jgi:hypothetical protein
MRRGEDEEERAAREAFVGSLLSGRDQQLGRQGAGAAQRAGHAAQGGGTWAEQLATALAARVPAGGGAMEEESEQMLRELKRFRASSEGERRQRDRAK